VQEKFGAAIRSATVLAAIASIIALAGCAASSSPAPANADPAESAEARACLPDPALLRPQGAPDCEFGRSHRTTLDAEQWSRLKLEFERNCYRNAEKATRETMRKLQAASRCEIASVTP
jgi:hypothetical protein